MHIGCSCFGPATFLSDSYAPDVTAPATSFSCLDLSRDKDVLRRLGKASDAGGPRVSGVDLIV